MNKKIILIGAIAVVLIGVVVTTFLIKQNQDNRQRADEGTPTITQGPTLDAEEWNFLRILNEHRQGLGLTPLKVSKKLTEASTWMSIDMAARGVLPADHSDSLGRAFQNRIMSFGYSAVPMGENIAKVGGTGQSAFNAWLASTMGHKEQMEATWARAIGISRVQHGNGWFWTTDFGSTVDTEITPTATPSVTESPSPSETITTTINPTETISPTTTVSPTEPTETVSPTTTASPTTTTTIVPTVTSTPTSTPSPTPTRTPTPTPTKVPTATPTRVPTLTVTPTSIPSLATTPTAVVTATPTPTPPTVTIQVSPTPTALPPIATSTPVPTIAKPGGLLPTMGIFGGILIVVVAGIFLLAL